MCKKIISVLVVLMMVSGMISIPAMAADTADSFILAGAGGYSFSYLVDSKGYSSLSSDVKLISEQSLKLNGNGTTDGWATDESARWNFYNKLGKTFDWSDYSHINVMVKSSSDAPLGFRFTLGINKADFTSTSGYWYYDVKNVIADNWTVVSMETSKFIQTYTGTKTEGDKWSEMNTIQSMVFDGIKGEFYVDSIWLSTSAPEEAICTGTSVENGADNVIMSTTEYLFTYSKTLASSTAQNATVEVVENGEVCNICYSLKYSGNQFKLTFDEMLKPATTYSIAIAGVLDCFGMMAESASVGFTTSSEVVFPDEVVVADFTKMDDINKAGLSVDSKNKIFGDKSGTFSSNKIDKGNIAMNPIPVDGETIPADWSQYTHLNLWIYSEEVTDVKYAILMRSPGTSGNLAYNLQYQDFVGWKKVSVDLSKILADKTHGANFDMKNIDAAYVSLVFSNINGDSTNPFKKEYKKLSFAKMWLSTEKSEGIKEIYNSSSTSATNSIFNNAYATISTEVTDDNNQSLKLTGDGTNNAESKNPIFASEDWSSYKYLNFRMKNGNTPAADGTIADVDFYFYFLLDKANANTTSGYWYTNPKVKASGSEWQTVSVAMPDGFGFMGTKPDAMTDVEGLRFDFIKGTVYVEKIWLSTEPCTNVPELEKISVEDNTEISAYTRKIDFKYSEPLSAQIPTVTVTPEADYMVSCENDNVSVIFPEGLAAGKNYTVTVGTDVKSRYGINTDKDASVSFATENYSAQRSDSAVFARYASDSPSGDMIIAVYDAAEILASVSIVSADSVDGVLSLSNDYLPVFKGQSVKIFVWDFENLVPVTLPVVFE